MSKHRGSEDRESGIRIAIWDYGVSMRDYVMGYQSGGNMIGCAEVETGFISLVGSSQMVGEREKETDPPRISPR